MRRYLTITWPAVCFVANTLAQAHPGHGDAAHFLMGGSQQAEGAHHLLAQPWFAATLLVVSVLVMSLTAARARSQKLPRPRVDPPSRTGADD